MNSNRKTTGGDSDRLVAGGKRRRMAVLDDELVELVDERMKRWPKIVKLGMHFFDSKFFDHGEVISEWQ